MNMLRQLMELVSPEAVALAGNPSNEEKMAQAKENPRQRQERIAAELKSNETSSSPLRQQLAALDKKRAQLLLQIQQEDKKAQAGR